MGSRSEKKQPGALVGEKSQTVFSANWKLDVMLLKNLQMLDVSKHRVGHRIAMDQRIVNKRFQTKLYRSKVTHARMTNNRDLLRELIHRDNYTFNTSVGGQDEKYTVQISPRSPNQEEVATNDRPKYGNGKGIRPAATSIVVVAPNADGIQSAKAVYKPGVTKAHMSKRPSSSVSIAQKTIARRSATADAASSKQDAHPTIQVDGPNCEKTSTGEQIADLPTGDHPQRVMSDNRKLRPKTAMPGLSKTTRTTKSNRPKTAVARQNSQWLTAPSPGGHNSSQTRPTSAAATRPTSATPRPTSATPRPKSATSKRRPPSSKQKHTMPSIFGEDKQPTLIDINKERLLRSNFPDRVKNFAGTLKGLQTDPDQTVDYYTLRLLENLQCAGRKGPREFIESDAEKRDAQRSIGNLNSLNMTFGAVKKIESGNDHLSKQTGSLPVRARLRAWESDDDDDDDDDEDGDDDDDDADGDNDDEDEDGDDDNRKKPELNNGSTM